VEGKKRWQRSRVAADHGEIQKHMDRSGTASGRKVGLLLGRLRESRRKADYEDVVSNPPKLLEAALADAREVLRLLPTS
jgi:hypothetical protein